MTIINILFALGNRKNFLPEQILYWRDSNPRPSAWSCLAFITMAFWAIQVLYIFLTNFPGIFLCISTEFLQELFQRYLQKHYQSHFYPKRNFFKNSVQLRPVSCFGEIPSEIFTLKLL